MKTFPDLITKSLILEKINFEYGMEIPPDIISNLTIERLVNFETKGLRTFFRTFIPGRIIRQVEVGGVRIFHSWWDHFKFACFPAFLKRRFPAKYRWEPIIVRHYHLCPHTGLGPGRPDDKLIHWEFLEGFEPADWMKSFVDIAVDNQFGKENSGGDHVSDKRKEIPSP